jgi:chromosome transmission fidelity protein 18
MSSNYGDIPSFDPAIYLHSELDLIADAPASSSHSDELEALQEYTEAQKAKNKQLGVVIQHRAWRTVEAFRSEEGNPIGTYSAL